tara:strand:+ start:960 stop:1169 length:210 start_codon:yes stop_codon:yes gene_type:complete
LIAKAKVGGVGINNAQTVTYGDNLLDAFGRLKISNPVTLLDVAHTKGKNNLLVHEGMNGTDTISRMGCF